jgi:uracil-DNA glycosylase
MREGFPQFCAEFLRFQLTTVRPQLVVTLGPEAADGMAELNGTTSSRIAGEMTIGDLDTYVLSMSHPYGDFNFDDARLKRDADVLSQAWSDAMRIRSSRER